MIGTYSEATERKAAGVPTETIKMIGADPNAWSVTSTRTGKAETVMVSEMVDPETGDVDGEWITCSCANGAANGGAAKCYHACAAEAAREKHRAIERDIAADIEAPGIAVAAPEPEPNVALTGPLTISDDMVDDDEEDWL